MAGSELIMSGGAELGQRVRRLLGANEVNAAATEVLREYGAEIFGFLRGALRSDPDADEVFGATSERIWRGLETFEWRCTVRTWVYTIARNEMARFVRGERRRNAGRTTSSELETVIASVRNVTASMISAEKQSKLEALRDELSVDDRELLILRVDRGLSWHDIALTSLSGEDGADATAVRREAARLRKRFQLVRDRLAGRARDLGLLG